MWPAAAQAQMCWRDTEKGAENSQFFQSWKPDVRGVLQSSVMDAMVNPLLKISPFLVSVFFPLADIPGAQVTYLHACHAALTFSGDSCPGDTFPSCWIRPGQSHQAISRWISFSQDKPAIKLNAEDLTAFACCWMAPELDLPTNLSYFVARLLNKSAPTPLP